MRAARAMVLVLGWAATASVSAAILAGTAQGVAESTAPVKEVVVTPTTVGAPPPTVPAEPVEPELGSACRLYEDGSERCETPDFGVFAGCVIPEWGCQTEDEVPGLLPVEDVPVVVGPERVGAWEAAMSECMAVQPEPTRSVPLAQLQSGCADAVAEGPLGDA